MRLPLVWKESPVSRFLLLVYILHCLHESQQEDIETEYQGGTITLDQEKDSQEIAGQSKHQKDPKQNQSLQDASLDQTDNRTLKQEVRNQQMTNLVPGNCQWGSKSINQEHPQVDVKPTQVTGMALNVEGGRTKDIVEGHMFLPEKLEFLTFCLWLKPYRWSEFNIIVNSPQLQLSCKYLLQMHLIRSDSNNHSLCNI